MHILHHQQAILGPILGHLVPPTASEAGIAAAHAWAQQSKLSMADYRDMKRCAFVRGLDANDSDAALASVQFNQGFAVALAQIIAGDAQ
ncbi:hypothetical protein ACMSSJ_13785 [Kerstersia gyiorum]|uniref:hypothetical protein n=1 Tax=Kerstersia gyiorum TaxID=206506 RepID=UPI0039E9238D